jgi:hypothetical protein
MSPFPSEPVFASFVARAFLGPFECRAKAGRPSRGSALSGDYMPTPFSL